MKHLSWHLLSIVGSLVVLAALFLYGEGGDHLNPAEHFLFSLSMGVMIGFTLLQISIVGRLRSEIALLEERLESMETSRPR